VDFSCNSRPTVVVLPVPVQYLYGCGINLSPVKTFVMKKQGQTRLLIENGLFIFLKRCGYCIYPSACFSVQTPSTLPTKFIFRLYIFSEK
jgi:hypothetical protein